MQDAIRLVLIGIKHVKYQIIWLRYLLRASNMSLVYVNILWWSCSWNYICNSVSFINGTSTSYNKCLLYISKTRIVMETLWNLMMIMPLIVSVSRAKVCDLFAFGFRKFSYFNSAEFAIFSLLFFSRRTPSPDPRQSAPFGIMP